MSGRKVNHPGRREEPIGASRPSSPFTVAPAEGHPVVLPIRGRGSVKVSSGDSGGALSVYELLVEPGEGPGVHVHTREHELWYVLDGEFRFLLGDVLLHQEAGGLAIGPPRTPHTFQNVGRATGRLLAITTPSGLEEFFLEYDRTAKGPYDMAALAAAALMGGLQFVGPPLPKPSTPPA